MQNNLLINYEIIVFKTKIPYALYNAEKHKDISEGKLHPF